MNTLSTSRWTLLAGVAAAASLLACGVGQDGSDPTLVSYDEPLTSATGAQTCANPKKVLICHIPPGNPANAHSICVGKPAQPAHLAHGDTLGACATNGGGSGDDDGGIEEGGGNGGGDHGDDDGDDDGSGGGSGGSTDAGGTTPDADAGTIL